MIANKRKKEREAENTGGICVGATHILKCFDEMCVCYKADYRVEKKDKQKGGENTCENLHLHD